MHYTTVLKFFLFGGVVFMLAGSYSFIKTKKFVDRSVSVEGVVVRLERSSRESYKPIVEYVDHNGTLRTLYSRTSSSPPSFFEGQKVRVRLDPSDPEFPLSARIDTTLTLWGLAGFLVLFGLAWIIIASLVWYVQSKGGVIYFSSSSTRARQAA